MVGTIQLLRNIGQFDSITPGTQLPFAQMTLVYAENGRGKTTIAAILRSLGTGDPALITDRHRVGSAHPPHVVVSTTAGAQHSFQNGAWSAPLPEIAVFDDAFVSANVCSGIEIETGHQQRLHELILGAQGVALNATLQGHIEAIEEHNRQLRRKEQAIAGPIRGNFSVEDFCALPNIDDIDTRIENAERGLAAAKDAAAVQAEPEFTALALPAFDSPAINELLARDLPQLEADAAAQVQAHLVQIGDDGERWISEGVAILSRDAQPWKDKDCPFCAQPLADSPVISHYQAYFGAAYTALKTDLNTALRGIMNEHGGEAPAAFERSIANANQRRVFWLRFLEVPELAIDTVDIARKWKLARDKVRAALVAKQAAPLEPLALDQETTTAIAEYHAVLDQVAAASAALLALTAQIGAVKEQAQAADVAVLTVDLNRLKVTKTRYREEVVALCDDYLAEKAAKIVTEAARDAARAALDNYRQNVFPAYEAAINNYLVRFNAGFRLGGVASVNHRGGSSATYSVVINNTNVPLTANGGPSFRTALSAGDRNTLALAFFFASLEQGPNLANRIVVIDDPMTSLDEHRSVVTVQEIRQLLNIVAQIIVLSHSKPFLISLWREAPVNNRAAIRISRAANGSVLENWNVNQDSITLHDHRYARVLAYTQAADPARERTVAEDLRPMLEAFLRVAYPVIFTPGSMCGQFLNRCQQTLGLADQILGQADCNELQALVQYSNRFHHDTNPTWQTEHINDGELTGFAIRTLAFIRRT